MKIDHQKINSLTEHKYNYKLYNPPLLDAFLALYPASRSKLSLVLLNIIMSTKRYLKPDSKYFSEEEDRRIYNNKYVSLENILDRCHPVKYIDGQKDIANDVSNLMKRLQDLEDLNIFYSWRYGSPYTYMFIFERYIGLWKYFNENGCVTPKSLSKIIMSNKGIIESMVKMEKSRGRTVVLQDVESSYMRDLLGNLIKKMNPEVSKKIPIWDGEKSLQSYLNELQNSIKDMGAYEGLTYDPKFCDKLPEHLRDKIEEIREEPKSMDTQQLTKDLVPLDENIVKKPTLKTKDQKEKKEKKETSSESIKAKRIGFEALDPFNNCNQFMSFYREVIRMYNKDARFYPFDAERIPATQIMDLLIENGKGGDKDFLRSWIRFYINASLQGSNVYKQEKTSLLNFKKTFQAFGSKYFRG